MILLTTWLIKRCFCFWRWHDLYLRHFPTKIHQQKFLKRKNIFFFRIARSNSQPHQIPCHPNGPFKIPLSRLSTIRDDYILFKWSFYCQWRSEKKQEGKWKLVVQETESNCICICTWYISWVLAKLILVITATTSGGVLFQAGACFSKEFWSVLATFRYFVTNLRTFWFPFYRPKLCGGSLKIDKNQVWVLQTWASRHLIESKFLHLNFCLYLYLFLYLACGVAKTEPASILCRATFSPASKIGGAHPTKDEHKRGKCENSASEKLKMRTFCFLSPGLDNFWWMEEIVHFAMMMIPAMI